MSKKKLLEEGTVRQFMKLANLKPLASDFITENYEEELYEQEDEELEGELPPEAGMEVGPEEPLADEDVGGEFAVADDALADVPEEAIEKLVSVIGGALEAATGIAIDVTGGEEGMEGEEGMDFAPAEEMPEEGEEELEDIDMVDTDAVMQETYRRVTKRLGSMNKQHKLVESVTNRIMRRLNSAKR